MALTTTRFNKLIVETTLAEIFQQGYEDDSLVYNKVYNVKNTERWTEKHLTIANPPLFSQGSEGATINTSNFNQKYQTDFTQLRYEGGFAITYEMRKFDLYDIVNTFGKKTLKAAQATIEYYAADLFNNQTSTGTGYVLSDSAALVSSSHVLTEAGTTASNNAGAADIGVSALESAIYHYEMLKDDQGNPTHNKMGKTILFHPNDRAVVTKILKSVNVPFEFSNTYNFIKDYNLVPLPWKWLSDTDAWFLLSSDIEHNWCYMAQNPDIEVTYDGKTRDQLVTSFIFFDFGFDDYRDVYGGQGA